MLLIVHAFVDEIVDQAIVILNMTEADVLRLSFFNACCNIFFL